MVKKTQLRRFATLPAGVFRTAWPTQRPIRGPDSTMDARLGTVPFLLGRGY